MAVYPLPKFRDSLGIFIVYDRTCHHCMQLSLWAIHREGKMFPIKPVQQKMGTILFCCINEIIPFTKTLHSEPVAGRIVSALAIKSNMME